MSDYPIFTPDMLNDIAITLKAKHRRLRTAIVILRKAASIDPTNHKIMTNLANFLAFNQDFEEAEAIAQQAVSLDPSHVASHAIMGSIHAALGRYPQAIESYNRAVVLGGNDPLARFDRALCHLAYGDWEAGFRDYEAIREFADRPKVKTTAPYWRGEDLTDKTLWVVGEQGVGDMIMVSRFLEPLTHAREIIFDCPPTLMPLMASLPVTCRPMEPKVPGPDPGCDYYCYSMSLPGIMQARPHNLDSWRCGLSLQLAAAAGQVDVPQAPPGLIRVGVCWRGGPWQQDDHRRSIPLKEFMALFADHRFAFYGFQVGQAEEIELNKAHSLVFDLAPRLLDWRDTAAALLEMDLVVSVCTGTAHLAGALGIPTFTLLPWSAHWVWLRDHSNTPWYPSMRLFRQKHPNNWLEPLAAVQEAMFDLADAKVAAA